MHRINYTHRIRSYTSFMHSSIFKIAGLCVIAIIIYNYMHLTQTSYITVTNKYTTINCQGMCVLILSSMVISSFENHDLF